jgi:mRNA-degrading endonuclease RelE of RelBE toxin-antitoxin system
LSESEFSELKDFQNGQGIDNAKKYMLIFKESPIFTKQVTHYLNDDEYAALQWALAEYPDAGDLIPRSGGLRKLRWQAEGRGKRGGYRVIYYWRNQQGEIWLLTMYAKNEAESIPVQLLKKIKEALEND